LLKDFLATCSSDTLFLGLSSSTGFPLSSFNAFIASESSERLNPSGDLTLMLFSAIYYYSFSYSNDIAKDPSKGCSFAGVAITITSTSLLSSQRNALASYLAGVFLLSSSIGLLRGLFTFFGRLSWLKTATTAPFCVWIVPFAPSQCTRSFTFLSLF
jgi:hypothetical protein